MTFEEIVTVFRDVRCHDEIVISGACRSEGDQPVRDLCGVVGCFVRPGLLGVQPGDEGDCRVGCVSLKVWPLNVNDGPPGNNGKLWFCACKTTHIAILPNPDEVLYDLTPEEIAK